MRLSNSSQLVQQFFQNIRKCGFFFFVLGRYKDNFFSFNLSNDFFRNFDKFGEGDPIINEFQILFDNNDKILQVRLTTNIASEVFKEF